MTKPTDVLREAVEGLTRSYRTSGRSLEAVRDMPTRDLTIHV